MSCRATRGRDYMPKAPLGHAGSNGASASPCCIHTCAVLYVAHWRAIRDNTTAQLDDPSGSFKQFKVRASWSRCLHLQQSPVCSACELTKSSTLTAGCRLRLFGACGHAAQLG